MKFTHLHVHSHYSLLDGLPKIDELLDYVQKLGMDSVALTDHGVLYGAVEFYKKAKAKGIKPIIGVEAYEALESRFQKRPHIDDKRYHLILLVKDKKGYKNLVKLVTKAHLEGFYYKPRIDEELLSQYAEGLIALSGCLQGKIPKLILAKKIEEAKNLALKYKEIFGKENFYLELQNHPNLPEQEKLNKVLISFSKELEIPLVATNDVHYLKPGDAKAQDILMLINTGADPNDPERLTMIADDFSLKTPDQMTKSFKNVPQAIENSQKIKSECNFEFKLGKFKLPNFEVPNKKTTDEYLRELCYKNLKNRYQKVNEEIRNRLNYELSMIEKTGFASYFLIIQDFVNWAKNNGIVVGPGRGSVAGSLVAYVLNITEIDPLKHDLLFERFLSGKRISPPDIDLDFTDTRRDEVIEYVSKKYGRDKVAQIITFGTMAARAVIRDVGRVLKYPYGYCDKIAKTIPMGYTLEKVLERVSEFRQLYKEDEKAKKLIDMAKQLEGKVRHASTHACGVVISPEPLTNLVPLQHPSQKEKIIVTQYEMHSIEDLGLLKMDFLALKNLTIIEDTINLVKERKGKEINLKKIPLNDKKTFQLLQRGETTSVFQLESEGLKRYLKQLKPTSFEDIIAMVALYRPGPIGLIPNYIERKHRKKKREYLHPKLKPILEKTYGVLIFQEQLMQIAQDLAGFTLSEADILRKAIGKKIKSLLLQQKEKFVEGMIKNEINEEIAQKIWEWILPFARYGFNRAHSASYATIAYQTAFLKTHYPAEFMVAVLNSEKADIERIGFLINEAKKMGIDTLPPGIKESEENFTLSGEKVIRFGLSAVKNVGSNVVTSIVKQRKEGSPFKSVADFLSRVESKDLNKKSLESLVKAGVFDEFEERNKLLFNLEKVLNWSREIKRTKASNQIGLFGGKELKLHLDSCKPASKKQKLEWEKELLGLYVTENPLEEFKEIFKKQVSAISNITNLFSNRRVKIGGIISGIKKVITRNGNPMLFMRVRDLSSKIEVITFPSIFRQKPDLFQENKIVIIKGRVDTRDEIPKIICEDIEEIVEK